MNNLCKKIKVTGRVQGVFFRAFTQKTAQDLQLNGWVQNQEDGSVLVFVCGEIDKLDLFINALRKGPPASRVMDLHIAPADYQALTDFTIK
ncbi:MAG: acylphosphatase [Legionellales bacterium]|jgi:acylphosphatase